ncbi:nicotinate phosphoribosyltransferase [Campylobacterota bacterium]|nr:nicotinate phosphoribosyltransferase [Campylobacterota bacterium]
MAISRGGLTIAHFLAIALNMKEVFLIRASSYDDDVKISAPKIDNKIDNLPNLSGKSCVLIADDIIDSGETLRAVLDELRGKFPKISYKTMAIFQKQNAIIEADFFVHKTDDWIEFFWEVDPIGL